MLSLASIALVPWLLAVVPTLTLLRPLKVAPIILLCIEPLFITSVMPFVNSGVAVQRSMDYLCPAFQFKGTTGSSSLAGMIPQNSPPIILRPPTFPAPAEGGASTELGVVVWPACAANSALVLWLAVTCRFLSLRHRPHQAHQMYSTESTVLVCDSPGPGFCLAKDSPPEPPWFPPLSLSGQFLDTCPFLLQLKH